MGCCQSTDAAVELKANTTPVDAPSKEEAPIKAAEEPAPPAAKVEKAKEPEPGKEAAPTGAAADKEEAPTPFIYKRGERGPEQADIKLGELGVMRTHNYEWQLQPAPGLTPR